MSEIETHVTTTLFPHQVTALQKTIQHAPGFANLSEMGTGKTLASISAMNVLYMGGDIKRTLIVCPNTLKYNWHEELKKSEVAWESIILDGSTKKRKEKLIYCDWKRKSVDNHAIVIITNYESLLNLFEDLNKMDLDLVIADEAHNIKNHKAHKTKSLKAIKAKFKWALTGTPVAQNVLDVWSIFDWIRPGHFNKSFYAFRSRYANVYTGAGFPMIKGWKNLKELKDKVDQYSFRVLKSECLDLPEKIFQTLEIDLSKEERRVYDEMANEMIVEIGNKEVVAQTMLTKLGKLQQMTSGFVYEGTNTMVFGQSKIDALEEILDSLQDKKIVIWCRFKQELKRIVDLALKGGRPHVFLSQEMDELERMAAINRFQDSPPPYLFIGNVGIGSAGINLFSSHHCIYLSNSWSLIDRLQSEDRLHRYGQKYSVNYYDIIARNTIDAYILSVIQNKIKMSDKVTGDDLKKMIFS